MFISNSFTSAYSEFNCQFEYINQYIFTFYSILYRYTKKFQKQNTIHIFYKLQHFLLEHIRAYCVNVKRNILYLPARGNKRSIKRNDFSTRQQANVELYFLNEDISTVDLYIMAICKLDTRMLQKSHLLTHQVCYNQCR